MENLHVVGWQAVSPASLGGQGTELLLTPEEYYRYLDQATHSLPDLTRELPPVFILERDFDAGAVFQFFGGVNDVRLSSAFEYRTQVTGQPMSAWLTCPSFNILLPNLEFLAGAVEVRAKAAGKASSASIFNRSVLTSYVYPIEILEINGQSTADGGPVYHAPGKLVKMKVNLRTADYIRLESSYGIYNFQSAPTGISIFQQDVSNLSGQRRLWLTGIGSTYATPKYVVNLES